MTWRGCWVGLVSGGAIALVGCAVPALRFADDAAADSPDETQPTDGPSAIDDASDSSLEAGCSPPQPQGAMTCCGTIWCIGECDANCGYCASCQSRFICCDKGIPGMIGCRPPTNPTCR
jgi:hypothetical protein